MYDVEWPLMRYPTYEGYSLEGLGNLADTLLFSLNCVNKPNQRTARARADFCVSAAPGMPTRYNFASRVVQGWVASDLMAVEGLVDEAWRKVDAANAMPLRLVNSLIGLERESRVFLDNLALYSALNVRELMADAADMSQGLLGRGPRP